MAENPIAENLAAETPGAENPSAENPSAEETASNVEAGRENGRKVREGLVLSAKMDKTVIVGVSDRVRHRRYDKTILRTRKFYAHDEGTGAKVGDRVRIQETRPLSKLKRWRIVEILEQAR